MGLQLFFLGGSFMLDLVCKSCLIFFLFYLFCLYPRVSYTYPRVYISIADRKPVYKAVSRVRASLCEVISGNVREQVAKVAFFSCC